MNHRYVRKIVTDSDLVHAASRGWRAKLKKALRLGADPDALDCSGKSALHRACESRHRAIVWILVSFGADVNIRDSDGGTALWNEAAYNDLRTLWWLIQLGADPNASRPDDGRSALHWACQHRNLDAIQWLVEAGATIDRSANGTTPLTNASARPEDIDVLRLLIELGADVNYRGHCSALQMACAWESIESAKVLIEAGASLPDLGERDADGLVPLETLSPEFLAEYFAFVESANR